MKGSVTHSLFSWALGLVAIGAVGLYLSNQWFADEVCTTAEWKCSLGDVGSHAAFIALPIGILLGLVALVTWVVTVMSRRA
jgi:hypothetical protein